MQFIVFQCGDSFNDTAEKFTGGMCAVMFFIRIYELFIATVGMFTHYASPNLIELKVVGFSCHDTFHIWDNTCNPTFCLKTGPFVKIVKYV